MNAASTSATNENPARWRKVICIVRHRHSMSGASSPGKSRNRKSPIKGNVKRKNLPFGSMLLFFSRHSAQPFERPLQEWSSSGPEVVVRLRVRSGESILLSCGPIKGNVKRKNLPFGSMPLFFSRHSAQPFERPLDEWQCMVLSETLGLWLSSIVREGIGWIRRLASFEHGPDFSD